MLVSIQQTLIARGPHTLDMWKSRQLSQVLGRGSLAEARNPSAARIRRVRDAKKLGRVSPVEQVIAEEGVHKMFFFLQNPRNFKTYV